MGKSLSWSSTSFFLGEKRAVSRRNIWTQQNVPVGTGRPGDFPQAVLPWVGSTACGKATLPNLTGLLNSFCSSLLSLIVKYCPRQHVFGVWKEKNKGVGCMKPMWKQKEETAISSTSRSLYFVLSCERETIVLFQKRESRERKKSKQISQRMERVGGRRKAQEKQKMYQELRQAGSRPWA